MERHRPRRMHIPSIKVLRLFTLLTISVDLFCFCSRIKLFLNFDDAKGKDESLSDDKLDIIWSSEEPLPPLKPSIAEKIPGEGSPPVSVLVSTEPFGLRIALLGDLKCRTGILPQGLEDSVVLRMCKPLCEGCMPTPAIGEVLT